MNEVLRVGLQAQAAERARRDETPRRTRPIHLGKPVMPNLDNIAEALAAAEGEDFH